MDRELLEIYSDYLICSFGYATATGLSKMLDGAISHDKITRFLSSDLLDSRDLWRLVKPLVRKYQQEEAVIVIDDTIEEKPYTDESSLICWHFDHSKGRSVKGINIVNVLYETQGIRIPVSYTVVEKTKWVWDKGKKKEVRKSETSKNGHVRRMLKTCVQNDISFKYVIADTWYGASETMKFICRELKRSFVMPLKSDRNIALTEEDKQEGKYQEVKLVELEQNKTYKAYVKQLEFPLLLIKQVFKEGDESETEGVLYLVTDDLTLEYAEITALYQRRWCVEEFHASIKGNTALELSPTQTIRTQKNHIFGSIYGYVKLEKIKIGTGLNHFALRSKMYVKALQAAHRELKCLENSSKLKDIQIL